MSGEQQQEQQQEQPLTCPVDHKNIDKDHPLWSHRPPHAKAAEQPQPQLAAQPSTAAQTAEPAKPQDRSTEGCRFSADDAALAALNNMPAPGQRPSEGQRIPLPTEREVSSIPMGGAHTGSNWVYPSEQMFFNAMRRKNWNASEEDMRVIVPIHNAVNEQSWRKILEWEAIHKSSCGQPKLLKFEGKPKNYSPKARFMSLLGYKLPFDRHDWTVDRCGTKV
eukprot:jgi/Hompol1/2454/HPOL_005576-RA